MGSTAAVQRLMRVMGIEALVPRPGTSEARPGKRGTFTSARPEGVEPASVGGSDLRPMASGFLYLVAIINWVSQRFWRGRGPTRTMRFCAAALEEALLRFGKRGFQSDSKRIEVSYGRS